MEVKSGSLSSGIEPLKSGRDTYAGLPVHLQGYSSVVYSHKAILLKYNGNINYEVQLSASLQWKANAALTNPPAPPPHLMTRMLLQA